VEESDDDVDISEGGGFTNEVGASGEDVVEGVEGLLEVLLGLLGVLLVVGDETEDGVDPGGSSGGDLVVGNVDEHLDAGGISDSVAEEDGVLLGGSN